MSRSPTLGSRSSRQHPGVPHGKKRPFKNDVLLVGFNPTPLKNMSQMGVWFPNIWKNKNVPNHQPEK